MKVFCDNTTTVTCINKLGTSHSPKCHSITVAIWEWARANLVHITCAHIPGHENTVADKESRLKNDDTEWMLDKIKLKEALNILDIKPSVDLFASRINK